MKSAAIVASVGGVGDIRSCAQRALSICKISDSRHFESIFL